MFYNQTLKAVEIAVKSFQTDTDLIGEVYSQYARLWEYVYFTGRVYQESMGMYAGATWIRRTNYVLDDLMEIMSEVGEESCSTNNT